MLNTHSVRSPHLTQKSGFTFIIISACQGIWAIPHFDRWLWLWMPNISGITWTEYTAAWGWYLCAGVLIYPINWMCASNSNEFLGLLLFASSVYAEDIPTKRTWPDQRLSCRSSRWVLNSVRGSAATTTITEATKKKKDYRTEYRFQLNWYLRLGFCYLQFLRIPGPFRAYWWCAGGQPRRRRNGMSNV